MAASAFNGGSGNTQAFSGMLQQLQQQHQREVRGLQDEIDRIGGLEGSMPSVLDKKSFMDDPETRMTPRERLINGPFEWFMGFIIVLNTIVLFLQLQYYGYEEGIPLGFHDSHGIVLSDTFWQVLQHIFNFLYVAELFIKLAVLRWEYFRANRSIQWMNVFDFVIVVTTCIDNYIARGSTNYASLRVLRICRIFRTFRLARTFTLFHNLRVLVTTVQGSFGAFFWSMVLMFVTMLLGALVICQSLTGVYNDDDFSDEVKYWVYTRFGTSIRSIYSMFEITLSGVWPGYARPLFEDVSMTYVTFFMIYIGGVVFAMIKIITALFLKDTMNNANLDTNMMIRQKQTDKMAYAKKLRAFFEVADTSGDGILTYEEFEKILHEPKAKAYLTLLELDGSEAKSLFELLQDDKGHCEMTEFVEGAMRLKGSARSQDVVSIMHQNHIVSKKIDDVSKKINVLFTDWKELSRNKGAMPQLSNAVHDESALYPVRASENQVPKSDPMAPRDDTGAVNAGEDEQRLDMPPAQSTKVARKKSLWDSAAEESPRVQVLKGPFEVCMGVAIFISTVAFFFRLQYNGYTTGMELGWNPDHGWGSKENLDLLFELCEHVFNAIFIIELMIKIIILKLDLFYSSQGGFEYLNIFDALVVLASVLDSYVLAYVRGGEAMNVQVFRLVRAIRVFRAFRVVRFVRAFQSLRILVATMYSSIGALFWSMVLLSVTQLLGALVMCQALSTVYTDPDISEDRREWIYERWGTAFRALYSMMEITFSATWPMHCRPLFEEVNGWYVVFFIIYISGVVFAMMGIIAALFLRETMARAAQDVEQGIRAKLKEKQAYAQKLQKFFDEADTSGDGFLTTEEFESILHQKEAQAYLSILELDGSESVELFNLLSEGEGKVSPQEFVKGAMRLKGTARSQDMISVMHDSHTIRDKCEGLERTLTEMHTQIKTLNGYLEQEALK